MTSGQKTPRVAAVIGAGFGDEGKGRTVDALAAERPGALVVRINGGAQAGHSVVAPDGRRHVFSHVPAGALADRRGHLSRHFTANPLLLDKEMAELQAIGVSPDVSISPASPVTTPYDMLINQIAEAARGGNRHGSCGVGYGETQERHERGVSPITAADLEAADLPDRLRAIRTQWVPRRLAEIGAEDTARDWRDLLSDDGLIEAFVASARRLRARLTLRPDADLAGEDDLILEGAQGLLLDQDLGWFPHVTRSYTGLPNAAALARDVGASALAAVYVTRPYLTRHGAGPLPGAYPGRPYAGICDPTNRPNPHQGHLRFAPLDTELLSRVLARDLARAPGLAVDPELAVTCLDQVPDTLEVIHAGIRTRVRRDALGDALEDATGMPVARTFAAPGRAPQTQTA